MNPPPLGDLGTIAAQAVLACLIVGTILALLAGSILRHAVRPATTRPGCPPDAKLPDGQVELIPVRDAQKNPNPVDPRIGRMIGRVGAGGPESLVAPLSGLPTLLGRVVILS